MKIQYKLSIMALGLLAFTSCEKNDPMADNMQIGEYVPTAYWEVGSTACKAGESFTFSGKYWTEKGYTPDHTEVWYSVTRAQESSASVKLAGTLLNYTMTVAEEDTVRTSLSIASFPHANAEWDGYEYVITGAVPTSSTLAPMKWSPKEWDEVAEKRFNEYFPAGFEKAFKDEVLALIVKDSYYSALRKVFCDYPFTNEQVQAINDEFGVFLPLLTEEILADEDPQAAVTYKSDLWYTTTASDEKPVIVAYYYTTIDEEGNSILNRVESEQVTTDDRGNKVYYIDAETSVKVFAIYDSAEWVQCIYDDNQGTIVSTVKAEYVPAFAKLLEVITFDEWVANGTDGYAVSFSRNYSLISSFKVFDTADNVGVAYDTYTISIN